jgi:undecaprenyl-diphosphatase
VAATLVAGGAALQGSPLDAQWLLAWQSPLRGWPQAWTLITWSALGACGSLVVLALSAKQPRRVAALLLALLLGGLLVHVIKRSLQLERPLVFFGLDHAVFQVIGPQLHKGSMPSGHSATAFAVAGLLVLGQASPWRHLWWLLAGLQAISRVVVGAHWPSDVLVGAGIGMALASLLWDSQASKRLGLWFARPTPGLCLAGLLPVHGLLLCWLDLDGPTPPLAQGAVMALSLWGAWAWWRASVARMNATP